MKIKTVRVNDMTRAMGIDTPAPVFHILWEENNGPADRTPESAISKLEVTVSSADGRCVWNPAAMAFEGSYIYYCGQPLLPKNEYSVRIKLLDDHGQVVDESGPVVFETGFMGTHWQAGWIEPVQEDAVQEKELGFFEMVTYVDDGRSATRLRPCQELRREFTCEKTLKKARVYATAHGIYNLYINGEKVSGQRLAPEVSCYDERLYYQTYDVTKLIDPGVNTIGAILADGWWIGRLGMAGDSCNYGNRLGFLMQMELTWTDGTTQLIVSDEQMQCRPSFIKYSDLFIGEKWDLNEAENFQLPGEHWLNCRVISEPMDNLYGQPLEPVSVIQTVDAPEIIETPKGELVLDFGQVLAGVVHLEFQGIIGDILTLEHSEILDEHGNFKCNILGRNKDQKDVCICRDGVQVFEPQFTYHGFRYVRIGGIRREQILFASARVIGTPLRKTGSFTCSDENLNQLQHNIEWSEISNMCSVPTDCPQREKVGWTGDIQVFARTGCFNYDLKNFLERWLDNMRLDQQENGEIPVAVPNFKHQDRLQRMMSGTNSSAVWGDACVLVPWYLYEAYGDIRVLKENFEMMQGWMNYIASACAIRPENYEQMTPEEKARNPYLWNKTYHFGDWFIPSLRELPNGVAVGTEKTAPVVGSAYYALVLKYFIQICELLGESSMAAAYKDRRTLVKDAVAKTYVADDGTVNQCDLQGLYVMILACEIVDGELKQRVLCKLIDIIRENDYCLDTGFSSVSYLLDVLYDNGYPDVAYRILFQTKAPSWLYMVENGATSIWENWVAVGRDGVPSASSYNHYAFGCVGDFIYRHIGGIQMLAPGYKKILFAPDMDCGLNSAGCSLETPYGTARCQWEIRTEEAGNTEGSIGNSNVSAEGTSRVNCAGQKGECRVVRGSVCVPAGTSGILRIGKTEMSLKQGWQEFCVDYPAK